MIAMMARSVPKRRNAIATGVSVDMDTAIGLAISVYYKVTGLFKWRPYYRITYLLNSVEGIVSMWLWRIIQDHVRMLSRAEEIIFEPPVVEGEKV